jgi:uroporphyrinogen decarboxylase
MDTKQLKQEYGRQIVFWGGGCDIEILQRGTLQEVEDEVKKRIDHLAPGGGFIFTPGVQLRWL